ncbi:hypothetical protein ACQP2U_23175 [Nocardia sp. CA-084685]|uniref:hypothetical protein n=1 Tax=Nocardia sp. CA-084685 TaxID=3239970 RepID=UPI003D9930F9
MSYIDAGVGWPIYLPALQGDRAIDTIHEATMKGKKLRTRIIAFSVIAAGLTAISGGVAAATPTTNHAQGDYPKINGNHSTELSCNQERLDYSRNYNTSECTLGSAGAWFFWYWPR